MSSHPISLSSFLISNSHLSQTFQVVSYLQIFLLTACMHYFSPMCDTRPTHLILGIKIVNVFNFLLFLPFRSKHFRYHPNFEHPHSTFFFPYERPRFAPIWRSKRCSPIDCNMYIFRHKRKTRNYGLNYSSHFLKLICP